MEKGKIALLVMALLLASAFSGFAGNSETLVASAQSVQNPLSGRVNPVTGKPYGDPLQYEWPRLAPGWGTGDDETYQHSSEGPGPNTPNILWSLALTGYSYRQPLFGPDPQNRTVDLGNVTRGAPDMLVGGYVFIRSAHTGVNYVNALDPFTGALKYQIRNPGTGAPMIVDPEHKYFRLTFTGGWAVYEVATGINVYNVTPSPSGTLLPHLGISVGTWSGTNTTIRQIVAWNLSETFRPWKPGENTTRVPPTTPMWNTTVNRDIYFLCAAPDLKILFYGAWYHSVVWAINASDGKILWEYDSRSVSRNAIYYEGRFIHHGLQRTVTCFNATTGEILWEWEGGARTYFGNAGAAGDGLFFAQAIDIPTGWIGCWNITTGELLWQIPGFYFIGYFSPVYADGKLYAILADRRGVGGEAYRTYNYWADKGATADNQLSACIDVLTGEVIWTMPFQLGHETGAAAGAFDSHNFIAYGCLWFERYYVLYCIGDPVTKDWPFFRGNVEQNAVTSERGPTDLSKIRWQFKTGGPVKATPIVARGKVYIGSTDRNIYCLDAYTGDLIWNFTTKYRVEASVAYYNGRIFTGADDGNIYCLDAENGSLIWSKDIGGKWEGTLDFFVASTTSQPRSSPIVVGGRLYVGAKDGKFYCLDTSSGSILWSYQTYGPILGSPAYYDGVVYVASTDLNWGANGRLYAFDALTGSLKWASEVSGSGRTGPASTPVIAKGIPGVGNVLLLGSGGATYIYGYNLTDGSRARFITNATFNLQPNATGAPHQYAVPYWNGLVFGYGGLYATCWNVTAWNLTTNTALMPNLVQWVQWINHNGAGSPLVSASISGTYVYVTSDSGSINVMDAVNGTVKSTFIGLGLASSSPVIWEGKLYIGHGNHYVYCFDDSPSIPMNIYANPDKGAQMWSNETIKITGRLYHTLEWSIPQVGFTESREAVYYPGIPNAKVIVTFIKPDLTPVNVNATTDCNGYFTISYNPNVEGKWQWMAWYEGQEMPLNSYRYLPAYSEPHEFTVTAPPTAPPPPTSPQQETQEGIPTEYLYATAAIIAIIIIIAAYTLIKKRKK